jgi:DNA helicase-2/ATP-dependent DNA helicase PcrA
MYRKDKGYRIGQAISRRAGDTKSNHKPFVGVATRGNQESADKMWILRTCDSRAEAMLGILLRLQVWYTNSCF